MLPKKSRSVSLLDVLVVVAFVVGVVTTVGAVAEANLSGSRGPSSFHLPRTYFVRTKLSTLPSSGT